MCLELSIQCLLNARDLNVLQSSHFIDLQAVDAKDRVYRMPQLLIACTELKTTVIVRREHALLSNEHLIAGCA